MISAKREYLLFTNIQKTVKSFSQNCFESLRKALLQDSEFN